MNKLTVVEQAPPASDGLADNIAATLRQVHQLREECIRLGQRVHHLETENAVLESENAAWRARFDEEAAKRDYYQRFTIELVTSLNLVGQVVDDAMTKAQQEAYRKNGAPPRTDIPELKIPGFLQKGPDNHKETQQ